MSNVNRETETKEESRGNRGIKKQNCNWMTNFFDWLISRLDVPEDRIRINELVDKSQKRSRWKKRIKGTQQNIQELWDKVKVKYSFKWSQKDKKQWSWRNIWTNNYWKVSSINKGQEIIYLETQKMSSRKNSKYQ